MKKLVILVLSLALCVMFTEICAAEEVSWENISRENLNLSAVLVDRDNPKIIYAGSNNAVIKTENAGDSWQNILRIKGLNRNVNFLAFDRENHNYICAATGNGLFCSHNQGKNWQKIFKGKDYLESDCGAVWIYEDNIYLGTKKGLFISNDAGRSWHKGIDKLANSRILSITASPNELKYITAASEDGAFITKDGGGLWERVFFAVLAETDIDSEETGNEDENKGSPCAIKYLITDPNSQNILYLATSKGVYKSFNNGANWDLLPNYGLLSIDIKFLAVCSDSTLYAVSKSGIFQSTKERWHEMSLGLAANDVTALDFDNQGNLYAASDKGIFVGKNKFYADKTRINSSAQQSKECINKIAVYSENEPNIRDIQEAAIKYAEVSPEKIAGWRKQAQKRAFLPKVSTGMNRNISDLHHWETGSTTKSGDDILNKGKDSIEWDISLSWDLSQLIWNNDQTSIDARSRLMVELRDSILDEVTKLYFERLRVKMELNNLSIEDSKKRFEKELKLQELTALLDALTNGFFSK